MKKMSSTALSNWKPRQPAAGLKRRIFAARAVAPEERSFWNLLVPAVACMMLSLLVMNSNNMLTPADHSLRASTILSNLSCSAYSAGGAQTAQNHLDSLTFEWTNRSLLSSPIGFTSSTN